MKQTINDKVSILRESFKAGDADLMETSGSFRVSFESGQSVYLYVETYDNSITARFETSEKEPHQQRHDIEMMQNALINEICFADIGKFKKAKSFNDRFVYTAKVHMDESVFFHETIVIGENKTDKDEMFVAHEEEHAPTPDPLEIKEEPEVVLSPVEKAIKELETIDSKMIRQSMDMMNLKRSSKVRMALTRIFRTAGDATELASAIEMEAGKLISENDFEDLRMIKLINTEGFLAPVIELLHDAVLGENPES